DNINICENNKNNELISTSHLVYIWAFFKQNPLSQKCYYIVHLYLTQNFTMRFQATTFRSCGGVDHSQPTEQHAAKHSAHSLRQIHKNFIVTHQKCRNQKRL
ncbi:MAG: hypothetical protein OXU51_01050, partial [Candidatus Poribacteria bacterium]|nr:hypothetical protein [Candidatus Poribacteria bacterium]